MIIKRLWIALVLFVSVVSGQGSVIISEFVADNVSGLRDEDLAYSDWIEVQNTGAVAVNLAGWSLTDDAGDDNKWIFPAVTLGPGQFLVVFASGKDRR
ncbi:MAG: lamin tail domain-containing protein, partial [Verrucomicrobiota bacterium]